MAPTNPDDRKPRPRLRDARIRTKLGLILVVPLAAVVAFAALRLFDSAAQLRDAETVRSLATVSVEATAVAHQLHQERIAAVRLLAAPSTETASLSGYAAGTDTAVVAYRAARDALGGVPDTVAVQLAAVDEQLATLGTLREDVRGDRPIAASAAVLRYGAIRSDLLGFLETVAAVVDDPGLSEPARAVAAWARAQGHAADAEAIAELAAASGRLSGEQLTAYLATQTGQQEAFLAFAHTASGAQQAVADQAVTGGSVDYRAATSASTGSSRDELAAAASALAGTVDAARWAQRRLQDQLLTAAAARRGEVLQRVLAESVAVLTALALALALAVLLARQLARSLARLRGHALRVADRELPETVDRLADPSTLGEYTPAQLAAEVREPAGLRGRDEIGQVAQSFHVVHRAAVRVAAEQAALRTSVSAMFLNLARRSQTLVDRVITQLDTIERDEADPRRLAELFVLDHLATRMRRNDENLLTLAGADTSPARTEHAPVADVLRAAQSEVEHYQRIEFGVVDADVSIAAGAVNDVVRLLAELLDNATRFSPPDAPVVCEARRLGEQAIVQVEDRGVGLPADQLGRINAWLAAPPVNEPTTFRKMGLAVVTRLANRHSIRVELRCDPSSGTVAYVALPAAVLILPPRRWRAAATHPDPRALAPPPDSPPARSAGVVRHAASRRRAAPEPTAGVPVAGRAPYELTAATPAQTVELPIFAAIEAAWFRDGHGSQDLTAAPAAPVPAPGGEDRRTAPDTGWQATPDTGRRTGPDTGWRTAADTGWRAAARASAPTPAGATASGLPRRAPQAQLVPGGVPENLPAAPAGPLPRRSPEEVRGLLSAYHRGVQRGRDSHRDGGPQ